MNRKHSKLKRHPLVRLMRAIFRLVRVIFGAKKVRSISIPSDNYIEDRTFDTLARQELENFDRDGLITVGDLLAQVKWQSPQTSIQEFSENSRIIQSHDVSRN